jgi:hypothetical protein
MPPTPRGPVLRTVNLNRSSKAEKLGFDVIVRVRLWSAASPRARCLCMKG